MQLIGLFLMAVASSAAIYLWWRAESRACAWQAYAGRWEEIAAVWELSAEGWRETHRQLKARIGEKQLTVFNPMYQAPRGLDD